VKVIWVKRKQILIVEPRYIKRHSQKIEVKIVSSSMKLKDIIFLF